MNEIIWAYDYGSRSRRRWSPKHDSLLWYVNDPERYTFNYDAIDRIPYMAPGSSVRRRPRAERPRPTSGGTPS